MQLRYIAGLPWVTSAYNMDFVLIELGELHPKAQHFEI